MSKNSNLSNAKKAKNDEFYTRLEDIQREMVHYWDHFRGKVIYCNCDDPVASNFFKYFSLQFENLGLKKLISTGYNKGGHGKAYIYEGDKNGNRMPDPEEIEVFELEGDGDFRSPECVAFLMAADIVITNPPFSLFREYIKQLMEYNKKFIILGNNNAVTYKEVFPLIKDNKMWLGTRSNLTMEFSLPDSYEKYDRIEDGKKFGKVPAISWFTNLEHKKHHYKMDLYKLWSRCSNEYPKYDNYDAIEVAKTCDIPLGYKGVMGVPITFLDKYCPEQFEIVGIDRYVEDNPNYGHRFTINGKEVYARILIRFRDGEGEEPDLTKDWSKA